MVKSVAQAPNLDDIAKFTVFLASDEAGACTAQHYVVDGGWA